MALGIGAAGLVVLVLRVLLLNSGRILKVSVRFLIRIALKLAFWMAVGATILLTLMATGLCASSIAFIGLVLLSRGLLAIALIRKALPLWC